MVNKDNGVEEPQGGRNNMGKVMLRTERSKLAHERVGSFGRIMIHDWLKRVTGNETRASGTGEN